MESPRRKGRRTDAPGFSLSPRVEPLEPSDRLPDLAAVLSALRHQIRSPVLFDGARAGAASPRWSLLAFDPLPSPAPADLAGLRGLLASLEPRAGDEPPGPFAGGFAGALSYDLGVADEPGLVLPPDPWAWPRVLGGLYVDYIVEDGETGERWLVLGDHPGDGRPPTAERSRRLRTALEQPATGGEFVPDGPLQTHVDGAEHRSRIERIRREIAAGDYYQANLSHRLGRDVRGDPLDLYLRLRGRHPAPYQGYARFAPGALLSCSPELLLEVGVEGGRSVARTRPIKGTAPRGSGPAEDRALGEGLLASAKDRAELAMIVDLERNDLGRLAVADGVRVGDFPRLESYATVHHLVADVSAELEPGVDALEVLAAVFPGGSITGAPKLASMEAIAALEGEGRGLAFGSLLHLDVRDRLVANLLIRSPLWRPRPAGGPGAGELSLRVGGGITWGSDPEAELAETRVKAAALLAAFEG